MNAGGRRRLKGTTLALLREPLVLGLGRENYPFARPLLFQIR